MRRRIAVGMLGLALAGCARSRTSMPAAALRAQPVGMEPVPSITDTINRGTGDPAVVQSTLPDPKSPRWSGAYIPPAGGPAQTPAAPQVARASGVQGAPAPTDPAVRASIANSSVLASPSSPPPANASGLLTGAGIPAAGRDTQAAQALSPSPLAVQAGTTAKPGIADLEISRAPDQMLATTATPGTPSPDQGLPPVEESRAASMSAAPVENASTPAAPVGNVLPPPDPPGDVLPPAAVTVPDVPPAGLAPTVPALPAATGSASAPSTAVAPPVKAGNAAAVSADPLLGPNPDLMPAIDPAPPASARNKTPQQTVPAAAAKAAPSTPSAAGPFNEIPLETAPSLPIDPQPAQGTLTPAVPAATPALPAENSQAGSPSASTALAPDRKSTQIAAAPLAPPSDPAVRLASFNPDSFTVMARNRNWKEAGRAAGRVNDEVITLHDLVLSIKAQLIHRNPGHSLSKEELNMAAKSMLAHLIERALITQEAKRVLKNPKQLDSLYEAADKYWREEELPPLLRHYLVENEFQLKQKLADAGIPIEFLRQSNRQEFLAQVYRDKKLSDCRKVDLPEMLQYYNDHYRDKEYDRPAQITWRELVVEKEQHPKPGEARRKADDLLARLTRGESFASLARKDSEGPSSIRAQGGLMQTSPGSYAVEAVNRTLETLPLNQVSPVLEGPTSYHIVLVENRHAAGPATFKEVQDEMRKKVMYQKMRKAHEAFIARLKRDALISTIFDGTESDPSATDKE